MSDATAGLRAEVENAVLEAIDRLGPGGVSRSDIIRPYLGKGVHRATLYRWLGAVMAGGKPELRMAEAVQKAVAERVAEPAKADARLSAKLPAPVKIEHIVTAGAIPVRQRLNQCFIVADQVMAHARTDDGKVRNSRLLLSASTHLRQCLETAARSQKS